MAAPRFERVFDTWDNEADITMVDLGLTSDNHQRSSPDSLEHDRESIQYSIELSRRQTDATSNRRQALDEISTRSLLRPGSYATTTDYNSSKGLPEITEGGATRQRQGFKSNIGSNIQQLWRKKSMGILSQRTVSTFDGNFAHGKPGWWHKQMLVDRSLRTMAGFTTVCAIVMFIIVICYVPAFSKRTNKTSTSVGGSGGESCHTAESRNIAVHLFVNIAATMVLGCSNTYQQLVTALKVDEIRWVLRKRGDSRVGTNSPWSINHKKEGKTKAWLCWWLLIATSIPVHFLANSVIGPSFYISMPTTVSYTKKDGPTNQRYISGSADDAACWTALRAQEYALPDDMSELASAYNVDELGKGTTFRSVEVVYGSNCSSLVNTGTVKQALAEANATYYYNKYESGNCRMGYDVECILGDESGKSCRMKVRMQAAIILAGCLLIKSAYMIGLNFRARHRAKDHCLTFGDVIIASVIDPDLKVKNECMLNSGDGYRQKVTHTCHKHCKDPVPSINGDSIGHCQKCKKFNDIDMSADLPHPSIAIKYKRSLLSNLGSTAITQMIILMFTSVIMVAISIALIVAMVSTSHNYDYICKGYDESQGFKEMCSMSKAKYMAISYGTWGGFSSSATLAALPSDRLSSEFTAFAISNGAQFLYSLLYMLLIYNLSLISMEHEWGCWETKRRRPRCTIVSGRQFEQSYFLQLPSKVLLPLMAYAALMHWLLGQAISTAETIYTDDIQKTQHSIYFVTYAVYPIWLSTILMVAMTTVCWWAFTYTREGFIPQMYGSIRTCCASTTELTDFNPEGIQWGDLGMGEKFRHAGFTSDEPTDIVPAELYAGRD